MVNADIMAIHLNYLQEVVQPEGDLNSKGITERITQLASQYPMIIKETGAGMLGKHALQYKEMGIKGIDVGGMSGTSFSAVEMHRANMRGDVINSHVGKTFYDWGIPTPVSIASVSKASTGLEIIATGGCYLPHRQRCPESAKYPHR